MSKYVMDWTIGETMQFCKSHFPDCPVKCPLRELCRTSDRIPAQWQVDEGDDTTASIKKPAAPRLLMVVLDPGAYMPARAHETDGGLDLRSPEAVTLYPFGSVVINTGVHIQLPSGTTGELMAKSGLNVAHGIVCTGLIDEGYTGAIVAKLYNLSAESYRIERGDKICQLVVRPAFYPIPVKAERILGGARGDNGFGSTGR